MDKNLDDYGLYWDQAGTESETTATPSEPPVPRPDPREAEGQAMAAEFDKPDQEVQIKERPSEPETFSQAFREARARGVKTFSWNGKTYTTQLKSEAKPRAPRMATVKPAVERATTREQMPSQEAKQPAAEPARPAQKPSIYSRSMAADAKEAATSIGDAIKARRDQMNARGVFNKPLAEAMQEGRKQ